MSAERIDLVEIDGRLRVIQEGLLQDARLPPVPEPAPPVDPLAVGLIAELRELADRQERLLGELRALLGVAQRGLRKRS